jgi:hypothetical protein
VVAAGGDGTINTVAHEAVRQGCLFGVLPQGTFNYFGRTHGIPEDLAEAVRALLRARVTPVQVGMVNDRIFLVNASVGLYPQLLEAREHDKAPVRPQPRGGDVLGAQDRARAPPPAAHHARHRRASYAQAAHADAFRRQQPAADGAGRHGTPDDALEEGELAAIAPRRSASSACCGCWCAARWGGSATPRTWSRFRSSA